MPTKLTVTTEVGTFTRTTDRTYTHLVVAAGRKHEILEQNRLAEIEHSRKMAKLYAQGLGSDRRPIHPRYIEDGSRDRWVNEYEAAADRLEAQGPITEDQGTDFGVLGWAGRLDLAVNVANSTMARRYRDVRIYDVATGQRVR